MGRLVLADGAVQDDLKNLLDAINVGTVFLGERLQVKRFSREAQRTFKLVPTDVGRPLADIKSTLHDVDLVVDITRRVEVEAAVLAQRELAEDLVGTVREPLLVLDGSLQVVSASRAFFETFGGTPADTVGRHVYEVGARRWDVPRLRELLEGILRAARWS